MILRHTCDTPPCIRPIHLVPGSKKDNAHDALVRGRFAIGERSGSSKLTEEDVRMIRSLHQDGLANTEIAPLFEISAHQIGRVVLGRNWAHVGEEL